MTTEKLVEFFEEKGFIVHLLDEQEDNIQCAEIEKWTEGGVDMIITLQPFIIKEFIEYVNDFSVDNEIDSHRQDERYKRDFTISESVEDFTDFHNQLIDIVRELEETFIMKNDKVTDLSKTFILDKITEIRNSLTTIEIETIKVIKDVLKTKGINEFDLAENNCAFFDVDGNMITKISVDYVESENEDGETFENSYNELNIDDLLGILSSLSLVIK